MPIISAGSRPHSWPEPTMSERILVVNAGSSSLKFQVHEIGSDKKLSMVMGGQLGGIGGSRPVFRVKDSAGGCLVEQQLEAAQAQDLGSAQDIMASWLQQHMAGPPVA